MTLVMPALLSVLLAFLALAGCTASAPPAGSCTLNLPPGASDEEAITAVLRAEGEFVVTQQIDALMALWAEDASISDAKNTPSDAGDDQEWLGKDAVRHRYVRTVFPGAPAQAAPADLQISIDGEHAVVLATTRIGGEVSPAGDRWLLLRQNGCWLLQNLTYNLEGQ